MKFQYYGTAAAEAFPGLFCHCDTCNRARAAGGKNFRTRSQACVDDRLLLDFPPDTVFHVYQHGLPLHRIAHCLLTHCHSDHLLPSDIAMRGPVFAHLSEDIPTFHLYTTQPGADKIAPALQEERVNRDGERVKLHIVKPFEPFAVMDYLVTPLAATHPSAPGAVFYQISDGKTNILYANDTAIFPRETWDYLAAHPLRFDFVSLDCTCILGNNCTTHMNFADNLLVRDRLVAMGLADEDTHFCCHHFSHNGGLTHDELVPVAAKEGFDVSYDGKILHF